MPYATSQQLADYLGVQLGTLPPDAGRLLARASELIQDSTVTAVYTVDSAGSPTDIVAITAFRDATTAQVEYWITGDEDDDISGPLESMSSGGQNQSYGSGTNRVTPMYLAPRAARHLRLAGLLDAGVWSQ